MAINKIRLNSALADPTEFLKTRIRCGNEMIIKALHRYLICVLLIVLTLMTGCASFMEGFIGSDTAPPSELSTLTGNAPLEYAISVYEKGDYRQASELFNALSETDTDSGQRPTAQLGKICCLLMLADSPQDIAAAMELWERLKHSESGNAWRMEIAILDPVIDRLSLSATTPTPVVAPPPVVLPPPATDKQTETELTDLKKKAAKTTELQRRLDAVIAENQTLKQKIKALEAIDQNIQKKKNRDIGSQ